MIRRNRTLTGIVGALLLSATALQADDVKLHNVKLRREGDRVMLHFTTRLAGDAVKSSYRLVVTPRVSADSTAMDFRPFVVNGRRMERRDRQRRLLRPVEGDLPYTYTNGDLVVYADTLDYAPWMEEEMLALRLLVQQEGCCQVTDLAPQPVIGLTLDYCRPTLSPLRPRASLTARRSPDFLFLRRLNQDSAAARGASVRFRVARTELDTAYSSNRRTLQQIIDAITLVRGDARADLERISIVGYASPEGRRLHNESLSLDRALALKAYIVRTLGVPDEQFDIKAGGEDWQGLRDLVVGSDMAYKQQVLDIIDHVPEAERQARLRQLAGGRPYRSMLDVLYPQLRDACYINVWYSERPDTVARTVNLAIEEIAAGRYDEALERLHTVDSDVRSWNAIGTCLILQGRTAEARTWLERAVEAGDDAARPNLEKLDEWERGAP